MPSPRNNHMLWIGFAILLGFVIFTTGHSDCFRSQYLAWARPTISPLFLGHKGLFRGRHEPSLRRVNESPLLGRSYLEGFLGELQICGGGDVSQWTDHTAHIAEVAVLSWRDGCQLERSRIRDGWMCIPGCFLQYTKPVFQKVWIGFCHPKKSNSLCLMLQTQWFQVRLMLFLI